MGTKVQHDRKYQTVLTAFLRQTRDDGQLTQRGIGKLLKKPQSYVYNCETGNRRVDIIEFVRWVKACGVDPKKAFERLLDLLG